jgi:hypothetical protein
MPRSLPDILHALGAGEDLTADEWPLLEPFMREPVRDDTSVDADLSLRFTEQEVLDWLDKAIRSYKKHPAADPSVCQLFDLMYLKLRTATLRNAFDAGLLQLPRATGRRGGKKAASKRRHKAAADREAVDAIKQTHPERSKTAIVTSKMRRADPEGWRAMTPDEQDKAVESELRRLRRAKKKSGH